MNRIKTLTLTATWGLTLAQNKKQKKKKLKKTKNEICLFVLQN